MSDEFYNDSPNTLIAPDDHENRDQNIEVAKEWGLNNSRVIILPTDNLPDLEDQWINFNNMIKKHRRESDWKSLELFNKTNQTRYEELRSSLLSNNITDFVDTNPISISSSESDYIVDESYIEPADSYYNADAINYTSDDVEKARKWAKESDRVIIIPTRTLVELECLWDNYNMMIKKHRRESDWMSLELFGLTNLKHYEYLKSQFLKQDINDSKEYNFYIERATINDIKRYVNNVCINESVSDAAKMLLSLNRGHKNICEELVINNIISDAIADYDGLSSACPSMPDVYGDMPYYSPEQMIDIGVYGSPAENYYGVEADNDMIGSVPVQEWFEMYKYTENGFYTEMVSLCPDWVNTVRTLMTELSNMQLNGADKDSILRKKQSILELGWNPNIPFTERCRAVARKMASERFNKKTNYVQVVNLSEFVNNFKGTNLISESSDMKYQPIYIVLIEGKSRFSAAIKGITHCAYSHVALSFDSSLSKMYSYGISERKHSGFGVEDIKNVPLTSKIGVYTFFVSKEVKAKIEDMVKEYEINIDRTKYSYKNLFTFLFNIPYNNEWKMICSQFVDRCLKLAGIDISNKDSSLVSPKIMEDSLKEKKKYIYELFVGERSTYNGEKIGKFVTSLMNKAKPIKEQESLYTKGESLYINDIINNYNNLPVLFELQDNLVRVDTNGNNLRILNDLLFKSINVKPYCENNSFPIQFDKNGDMIIKKYKKLDYKGEYAKSHKLLKQYKSSNNIEGMKYELAKLWMMITMIEETIHSDKFKNLPSFAIESSAEMKSKANIINDFQYYMKEVMKKEPDFNFTKYFEESPFNKAVMKISNSTLSSLSYLIKKFIKSF